MSRLHSYVRRHHVGLLALVLVLGGGTAYAADKLPKNSVVSSTVKNGALKGADLKDGTVKGKDVGDGSLTGADLGDGSVTGADLGDGSVTGTDLTDGTVGAKDLAADAVREAQLIVVQAVEGAGAVTVFSDPAIGTITFTCTGSLNIEMLATLPATATPGSVKVTGTDLVDDAPVGAVTVTQPLAGAPGGGGAFSGSGAVIPQGMVFYDTATKRLSLQWDVATGGVCTLRGELEIYDKPGTGRPAPAAAGAARPAVCTAQGAGWCEPS